jgi:hypothetical protein
MCWYRLILQFGRPSLVGTTVKSKEKLPTHLAVDEKHSWLSREKVFLPTTVAKGVFLGATVVEKADAEHLTKGYREFQEEASQLDPNYSPQSVCTDGFSATRLAWRTLYPKIVLILCYLHIIIKLRDRCRSSLRKKVLDRAWNIYRATTKRSFSQRARRFQEWATKNLTNAILEIAGKLQKKTKDYLQAYEHPAAYRTSNAVDRLMNYQDRKLFAMRYFHHSDIKSARLLARAMAMIWNFHPFSQRLRRNDENRVSPFADLNGFQYHGNWLQNFLIASSMGGQRL